MGILMVPSGVSLILMAIYSERIGLMLAYVKYLNPAAYLSAFGMILTLIVISFAATYYSLGLIYVQTRAFADHLHLSDGDAFRYVHKCFKAYLTTYLAFFVIVLAAVLIMVACIAFVASVASVTYFSSNSNAGMIVLMILVTMMILGVYAVAILFSLKWYFAFHAVFQYDVGGLGSLSYSDKLTKGMKGKLFGYIMMFAGIGLLIGILTIPFQSIGNNELAATAVQLILSIPLKVFEFIYFTAFFINSDALKQSYSGYYNLPLMTDRFTEFVMQNNIPREEDRMGFDRYR